MNTQPRRSSRRGRWRRIVVRVVLVAALVVAIAAIFRNQLVAPLLRPHLEQLLANVLRAERVEIGTFEGSWIGNLVVHDVNVTTTSGPLRDLRAATVSATYDLRALLRGDPTGLRAVRITADAAELDLRGLGGEPSTTAPTPPPVEAFDPILAIARDGVSVDVAKLSLRAADGEWQGTLHASLGAGPVRPLAVDFVDLQVRADVERFDGERLAAHDVTVALPAAAVELPRVSLPNPWTRADSLASEVTAEFRVAVHDLGPVAELLPPFVRERLPLQANLQGAIADGTLRLAKGEVHVPQLDLLLSEGSLALARENWRTAAAAIAITARANDFVITLPALGTSHFRGEVLGQLSGAIGAPTANVELRLGPCTSAVGSLAAANGTFRIDGAGIGDPRLRIDDLVVATPGGAPVALQIDGSGVLPLSTANAAATDAPFVMQVTASRAAEPNGTPALHLAATIRADRDALRCDDVAFAAGPASLRGSGRIGAGLPALFAGAVAAAPLEVDVDLTELDVAAIPRQWIGDTRLGGRLTGRVVTRGEVATPRPDVHLAWNDARLTIGDGLALHDGTLQVDLTTEATATVLRVDGSARVDVTNDERPFVVAATLRCSDEGTTLSPCTVTLRDATIVADLASDLRRDRAFAPGAFAAASLTGTLRAHELSLASIPEELHGLGPLEGVLDVDAQLGGTLGALGPTSLAHANVTLRGGNVRFGDGARLENIAAQFGVDPQVVDIVSLSGVMGAGRVTASGSLRTDGGTLLENFALANVDLRVHGDDALVYRSSGAKVRADADLTVTGTPAALHIGGELALGRGSKYVRRISVLPDLNARGGAPVGLGMRLPAMPAAIGSRITLDVAVRSNAPFEARTHLFDGDLDLALRLLGTGDAPRLEGAVTIGSGSIRFPGAVLRVTGGQLTFTRADPFFPRLQLRAEGKRAGVVVTMLVRGPYDRPEVTLTSLPPLPTQDLVLLLTTGQLPSTLVTRGTSGQARVVGEYLATEAWQSLFGSDSTEAGPTVFDRVTVETGREVSRNGIESVAVEYELLPDFGLRAERDRYEDFNLGIVLRFRLP